VRVKNRSLVFSGDLGRQHDVLMSPPSTLKSADVMIVESTYGNRRHPAEDSDSRLANIIRDTFARGGTILIPTFAVGRAQALLLSIARLKQQQRIPDLPVFVDSPMASRATQLYKEHAKGLRISSKELRMLCDCAKHVSSADESKKVTELAHPAIVLAGSGMATGGRILHHLRARASDPNAHIVFPGFQVPGTRGAKLVAGDRAIKIFGEHVRVNAEVSQLESLSGHADADEIMQWLSAIKRPPQHTFVVHGERGASDALRSRIHHELGWNASAVDFLQHVTI
jgi:metallo-beta-lactamase family protein